MHTYIPKQNRKEYDLSHLGGHIAHIRVAILHSYFTFIFNAIKHTLPASLIRIV